jgi:hypothetical protein
MVGRVLTGRGITAYGDGHYSLLGGDELSDAERDRLLELCRQRLDAFREQRGEEVCSTGAATIHRVRHSYGLSSPTCPSADRQEKPVLTTSATMAVNQHWLRRGTRHHLQRAAALGGHR